MQASLVLSLEVRWGELRRVGSYINARWLYLYWPRIFKMVNLYKPIWKFIYTLK